MKAKNNIDEWLKSEKVKKHLKHFRWTQKLNSSHIIVHYDFTDIETIFTIAGCIEMGADPEIQLGYSPESIEAVENILEMNIEDRTLLMELFNYLEDECPRKKLKKLIPEHKIDYKKILWEDT